MDYCGLLRNEYRKDALRAARNNIDPLRNGRVGDGLIECLAKGAEWREARRLKRIGRREYALENARREPIPRPEDSNGRLHDLGKHSRNGNNGRGQRGWKSDMERIEAAAAAHPLVWTERDKKRLGSGERSTNAQKMKFTNQTPQRRQRDMTMTTFEKSTRGIKLVDAPCQSRWRCSDTEKPALIQHDQHVGLNAARLAGGAKAARLSQG